MHVYFKNYCIWQLVFDNVVEMDVGYEANGPSSKHPSSVFLSYYILHSLYYYMGNFCNLNGLEHQ